MQETILDSDDNKQTQQGIPVIEGPVDSIIINGSDVISIDNLDSDNRLYFNQPMIASNGIFINNVGSSDFWVNNFNLESA